MLASSAYTAALAQARSELAGRADILAVKPGYAIVAGALSDERVIVVVPRDGGGGIPAHYGAFRVELRGAALGDIVRDVAASAAAGTGALQDAPAATAAITYAPPPGVSLGEVRDTMHVLADVSPDDGWPVLSAFLSGVEHRLIVAMYQFSAPHIESAVAACLTRTGFEELMLVMQQLPIGGPTSTSPGSEHSNVETVAELTAAAGTKTFEHAWVATGSTKGWVASAYHIKVAVADGARFWLSSGNWATSNKPDVAALTENPPDYDLLSTSDRDCDVVVEHPGLAATFEAYIRNDYSHNRTVGPATAGSSTFPALSIPFDEAHAAAARRFFAPFEDTREFAVTPLLTPDNYLDAVVGLIGEATSELLIENQTIDGTVETAQGMKTYLKRLLDAILARKQAGVAVRLIFRDIDKNSTADNLAALKSYGFAPDSEVRAQPMCHTKIVVVDRKKVLVGSQNMSDQGISVNRDASLLFDDAPLAAYYGSVFDFDWSTLASAGLPGDLRAGVTLAQRGASDASVSGYRTVSWAEALEGLA